MPEMLPEMLPEIFSQGITDTQFWGTDLGRSKFEQKPERKPYFKLPFNWHIEKEPGNNPYRSHVFTHVLRHVRTWIVSDIEITKADQESNSTISVDSAPTLTFRDAPNNCGTECLAIWKCEQNKRVLFFVVGVF